MTSHTFTVQCDPVPASRPRVTRRGISYYAEPYKSFKKTLREEFIERWKGLAPLKGRLFASVLISKERPKKTKLIAPKPDVDNYAKAVLDAMNGVVLEDDSLVERLWVGKRWQRPGVSGSVVVRLRVIE